MKYFNKCSITPPEQKFGNLILCTAGNKNAGPVGEYIERGRA